MSTQVRVHAVRDPAAAATRGAQAARKSQPVQTFRDVGASDDRFEREAHAVADGLGEGSAGGVARPIRRMAPGEGGLRGLNPEIDASISAARGHGQTLPAGVASSFGRKLGADVSQVRIHADSHADGLSRRLNARAFTSGRDVFFRQGQYDPATASGQAVLAHELTHTVQQAGLTGGAAAPVQRLIMQVGADDDYTRSMSSDLRETYPKESYIQFRAGWDKFGSLANPRKVKFHGKKMSFEPRRKLKGIPKDEPLRIVAHGNIRGMVGGHSAQAMATLLTETLGLPADHKGGIDIYACLPANKWTKESEDTKDASKKKYEQPHIVGLQDALADLGRSEVVRGFEFCIFARSKGEVYEVSSAAYKLWSTVVMPIANSRRDGYQLSEVQVETMKRTLGTEETKRILADQCKKVGDTYQAKSYDNLYRAIRDHLEKMGLYRFTGRLRHADSVRLTD